MALKPTFTLAGLPKLPKPIPKNVGGKAKIKLTPAGAKYLAGRSGNPKYRGTTLDPFGVPRGGIGDPSRYVTGTAPIGAGAGAGGAGTKKVAKTPQEMLLSLMANYQSSQMTPAQIQAGIDAQIKSQVAAAQASTKALQYQAQQQANRAAGFAQTIGSLRAQEGQQIYSDYERAAQNIQGLGTGLTGAVAETQQAAADKAAAQLAQASGGINTAGSSYDIGGLRNTAQYTGVTLPARDLYGEAANQAAGVRVRNAAATQHIQNISDDFLQKGTEAQKALSAKRIELEAQRPDLYFKAVKAAQEGRRQDMATLVSAFALQNTVDSTQAEILNTKLQTQIDNTLAQNKVKVDALTAKNKTQADKIKALNDTMKANATVAKAGVTVAATEGLGPKGNLLPGYYRPGGKGTVPQPYDTDKYKIKQNADGTQSLAPLPAPPSTARPSTAGKWTPSKIQSAILSTNRQLPTAKVPGVYATITNANVVPYGIAPIYKPKLPLAKAIAQLRLKYPKAIRNREEVTTAIREALGQIGYKV